MTGNSFTVYKNSKEFSAFHQIVLSKSATYNFQNLFIGISQVIYENRLNKKVDQTINQSIS